MADTLTPEQEKRFEWTFEDYRNKESLAYMVATIGDVKKLKQFLASEIAKAKAEERDKMREIIGEDEHRYPTFNDDIIDAQNTRDKLRAEQRLALSELEDKS